VLISFEAPACQAVSETHFPDGAIPSTISGLTLQSINDWMRVLHSKDCEAAPKHAPIVVESEKVGGHCSLHNPPPNLLGEERQRVEIGVLARLTW
jgi:hypothetical protein